MTTDYVDIDVLQARMWPAGVSPADVDRKALIDAIDSASRWVEGVTGRKFYATTETRYFAAEESDILFVDDLLSVTTLYTDSDGDGTYEDTWTTSDFVLSPYNASVDDRPYTMIEIANQGDYSFPIGVRKGVKIIGSWGFSSVAPQPIREAALLQAARLYMRRLAPFGIVGSPDSGELRNLKEIDPDALAMLRPFVRQF